MTGVTYDFSGCRVLVTGGTRGLGHAVARALAGAGAEVAVTGTQAFTSYYDADLTDFTYHRLDLSDDEACAQLAERLPPPDVLVNAAGCRMPLDADVSEREFLGHAAGLGLVGPFHLAGKLRLPMSRSAVRGGGAVVNLPPVSRWFALAHGDEAETVLGERTRAVGASFARTGVRLNTVLAPPAVPQQRGGFRVEIDRHAGPLLTGHGVTQTQVAARTAQTAAQRALVDVALFLASSSAAGVTGQVLSVGL